MFRKPKRIIIAIFISNIPIQIRIISLKPDRVNTQPAADRGIIPAVDVVLQSGIGVKGFAGVAEKEWIRAGNQVAEGVVNEVGCGGSEDVTDRAEVVGQGPEDIGGSCVGEEFVLGVWRPEVMVRDGWTGGVRQVGVVKLNGSLIGFGDEY